MNIQQTFVIDWNAVGNFATAFAAVTALIIWLSDGSRRRKERDAAACLLAQVMIAPVAAAQVEIATVRYAIAPPDGTTWLIQSALAGKPGRDDLVTLAISVSLELPSQFLDKADLFPHEVSNKLAYALASISRLKISAKLLSGLSDTDSQQIIEQHIHGLLAEVKRTVDAMDSAYKVLLVAGRTMR